MAVTCQPGCCGTAARLPNRAGKPEADAILVGDRCVGYSHGAAECKRRNNRHRTSGSRAAEISYQECTGNVWQALALPLSCKLGGNNKATTSTASLQGEIFSMCPFCYDVAHAQQGLSDIVSMREEEIRQASQETTRRSFWARMNGFLGPPAPPPPAVRDTRSVL